MTTYLLINNTTDIIENIIEAGGGYTPPSGYYIEVPNGQNIGDVYDAAFHFIYVADGETGLYLGQFPYNDYPAGGVEVTAPPEYMRMVWNISGQNWYWLKPTLKQIVYDHCTSRKHGGVEVNSINAITTPEALVYYAAIYEQVVKQPATEMRSVSLNAIHCQELTHAEIRDIIEDIFTHVQSCYDATQIIFDAIESEDFTTPNDLISAWTSEYNDFIEEPTEHVFLSEPSNYVQGLYDCEDAAELKEQLALALTDIDELEDALDGKANVSHTHTVSQITDFDTAVDDRIQDIIDAAPTTLDTLNELAAALGDDPNFASTMTTALAGKVPTTRTVNGHALSSNVTVTKSDVSLGNVDNTADSSKAFSTSQITSGTFADGRIAQSNVTQYQAALSVASSQVTGTKTSSYISDFAEASQDAVAGALSSEFNYDDTNSIISMRPRTFNFTRRTLNSPHQISTTQDAFVVHSVDIACALTLSGGQAGTVYLKYADDSSFTTNVKEVSRIAASNTGTLTLGLALNQVMTGILYGVIPAGKYAKLVTENNTGSPTFTYKNSQEVLL